LFAQPNGVASRYYAQTHPGAAPHKVVRPRIAGDETIMANRSRILSTAFTLAVLTAAPVALSGCGDPYNPGARAGTGALIGAGGGAALGGIAGGGSGAAIGALAGGAVGAAGGAATTPSRRGY